MPATTHKSPGRPVDPALQQRRRDDILSRAAKTFAKHGYQTTDLQQIADALSLSKGTLYNYFPSKEDLFLATVRHGVDQLHAHIAAATEPIPDPIARLSAAVHAYLGFFKSHPDLVELFIQERAHFKAQRKPVYFESRDARKAPWRILIQNLIDTGRFRAIPVERIIETLGNILYGTMYTNHIAGRGREPADQSRDVLDVLFNGILSDSERKQQK
jgi:AcrR family transcriptional regulator